MTAAGTGPPTRPDRTTREPSEPHEESRAELVDRIAAAVTGCPGVARLASGPLGTYLAGRTVRGVAIHDDTVAVAVVATYGEPLTEVAERVRAATRGVVPDKQVDVAVDDLELEDADRGQAWSGNGGRSSASASG